MDVSVAVAVAVAVVVAVALSVALDISLPIRPLHCLPSKYCAVLSLVFVPSGAVEPGAPKAPPDNALSNEKDERR